MKLALRVGGAALALMVLGLFAYAHFDQSVDLHLGLFRLQNVPLPLVIYGAVVVGMLIMVGVGLRNDLRARSALKPPDGSSPGESKARESVLEEADTL